MKGQTIHLFLKTTWSYLPCRCSPPLPSAIPWVWALHSCAEPSPQSGVHSWADVPAWPGAAQQLLLLPPWWCCNQSESGEQFFDVAQQHAGDVCLYPDLCCSNIDMKVCHLTMPLCSVAQVCWCDIYYAPRPTDTARHKPLYSPAAYLAPAPGSRLRTGSCY